MQEEDHDKICKANPDNRLSASASPKKPIINELKSKKISKNSLWDDLASRLFCRTRRPKKPNPTAAVKKGNFFGD